MQLNWHIKEDAVSSLEFFDECVEYQIQKKGNVYVVNPTNVVVSNKNSVLKYKTHDENIYKSIVKSLCRSAKQCIDNDLDGRNGKDVYFQRFGHTVEKCVPFSLSIEYVNPYAIAKVNVPDELEYYTKFFSNLPAKQPTMSIHFSGMSAYAFFQKYDENFDTVVDTCFQSLMENGMQLLNVFEFASGADVLDKTIVIGKYNDGGGINARIRINHVPTEQEVNQYKEIVISNLRSRLYQTRDKNREKVSVTEQQIPDIVNKFISVKLSEFKTYYKKHVDELALLYHSIYYDFAIASVSFNKKTLLPSQKQYNRCATPDINRFIGPICDDKGLVSYIPDFCELEVSWPDLYKRSLRIYELFATIGAEELQKTTEAVKNAIDSTVRKMYNRTSNDEFDENLCPTTLFYEKQLLSYLNNNIKEITFIETVEDYIYAIESIFTDFLNNKCAPIIQEKIRILIQKELDKYPARSRHNYHNVVIKYNFNCKGLRRILQVFPFENLDIEKILEKFYASSQYREGLYAILHEHDDDLFSYKETDEQRRYYKAVEEVSSKILDKSYRLGYLKKLCISINPSKNIINSTNPNIDISVEDMHSGSIKIVIKHLDQVDLTDDFIEFNIDTIPNNMHVLKSSIPIYHMKDYLPHELYQYECLNFFKIDGGKTNTSVFDTDQMFKWAKRFCDTLFKGINGKITYEWKVNMFKPGFGEKNYEYELGNFVGETADQMMNRRVNNYLQTLSKIQQYEYMHNQYVEPAISIPYDNSVLDGIVENSIGTQYNTYMQEYKKSLCTTKDVNGETMTYDQVMPKDIK